jgi:hypothetical protein|tara:strand:- start:477 stop:656 length:180 start_codon:yes stop_codon:yes gene_type:complete
MIYKNITKSYNVLEKQNLRFPQTERKERFLNNLAVFCCWVLVSFVAVGLCFLGSALDKI